MELSSDLAQSALCDTQLFGHQLASPRLFELSHRLFGVSLGALKRLDMPRARADRSALTGIEPHGRFQVFAQFGKARSRHRGDRERGVSALRSGFSCASRGLVSKSLFGL